MIEIKPCPFCGSPADMIPEYGANVGFYSVVCSNHDCLVRTPAWCSKKTAIEMWNTRKEPKRCCGNCKHYSEDMCLREFVRDPFHYGNDVCDNWEVKG